LATFSEKDFCLISSCLASSTSFSGFFSASFSGLEVLLECDVEEEEDFSLEEE
jgi:hypothetical protein